MEEVSSSEPSEDLSSVIGYLSVEPIKKEGGKIYFHDLNEESETKDSLDKIKKLFKKFPRFYRFLVRMISPVVAIKGPIKRFKKLSNGTIINIGCG